jgi:hypothetical protein
MDRRKKFWIHIIICRSCCGSRAPRATPILNWPLPPIYEAYYRYLKAHQEGYRGTKDYIQILMLLKDHSCNDVTAAVEKAFHCKIYSYDGVKNFLYQRHEPRRKFYQVQTDSPPVWPNRVDHFDLLVRP